MEIDAGVYGLKDKVAIVTGGGAGIGRGIVLEFAKVGARIVVAEVDNAVAENVVEEVRRAGGRSIKVVADVQESKNVDHVVQQTLQEFGTIDILVNNVGGVPRKAQLKPIWETAEEIWDETIRFNIKPTFLFTRAVTKVLIDQKKGGSIINLSSISGWVPHPNGYPAYGLSKAGIINFTATEAIDLAKYHIRVNGIAPGHIDTPLSDQIYRDRPKAREATIRVIPLGYRGKPEDIGRVAVFLASDAASYVTGQTILVSGGLTHLFKPTMEGA